MRGHDHAHGSSVDYLQRAAVVRVGEKDVVLEGRLEVDRRVVQTPVEEAHEARLGACAGARQQIAQQDAFPPIPEPGEALDAVEIAFALDARELPELRPRHAERSIDEAGDPQVPGSRIEGRRLVHVRDGERPDRRLTRRQDVTARRGHRGRGRVLVLVLDTLGRSDGDSSTAPRLLTMKIQTTTLALGSPAPDFDLKLVAGGRVDRGALLDGGRSALLVFFKTECPTCRLAFPFLQRIWARLREASADAGFLAVGQNRADEVRGFLEAHGADFPAATEDEPYRASNAYGVQNVPSIFLLDGSGVVRKCVVGFSRADFDALCAGLLESADAGSPASIFSAADATVPVFQPG